MAKKAKKIKTKKGIALKIVNPNAAGIDIASDELQVCVPADRDADNNRCYGSYTKDLRLVCEYLRACRIDTVAMESTGVFWVQPFRMLKEAGFDVILVNARQEQGDVVAAHIEFAGQIQQGLLPVGRCAEDVFVAESQIVAGLSGLAVADRL